MEVPVYDGAEILGMEGTDKTGGFCDSLNAIIFSLACCNTFAI
jgi:hypothetical protein